MERQNKRREHKESRLCVSGIRIRFRWEFIGKFICKQDTEIEKTRGKKVKLPLGFHLKFSQKKEKQHPYIQTHWQMFFNRKSFSVLFFPHTVSSISDPRFLSPEAPTQCERSMFFLCHASGKFLLITHQACQWRDGSNWQRAGTVSWKVRSRM